MSIHTIYQRLVAAGMSPVGACAMMGNMQDESAMMATNVENRSGINDAEYTRMVDAGGYDFATDNGNNYGYGLCQWTLPSRKRKMLEFHRQRGKSIGDEDTQVDFAIYELQTEPEYRNLWEYLKTATGVYEAAERICKEYERPAETVINVMERAAYANQFYMMLGGMEVTPSPSPSETAPSEREPTAGASPRPTEGSQETEDVWWPPRVLALGMYGPDVVALQGLLIAHGYPAGISGTFDSETRLKTMAFQAEHGLVGDGIAGPLTWAALLKRG